MSSNIHAFGKLVHFIMRRDRFYLLFWILGLVSLATFFVPMLPSFFGDELSKKVLTEMMKNPAMVAMIGLSYGDSTGALFSLFMLVWSTLGAGIFNILFVVRHTRKDEEEGRSEIIAALPVGRSANLLAVLLVALAANMLIAAGTAFITPAFGVEGIGWQGALVYAAAIGAGGFVFAAITALLAQLFQTSKATLMCAFVLLGLFYLLRAFGDMDSSYEIASLISPLGLIERVKAWVSNDIWPLCVLLAEALGISLAAFILSSVRDIGSGLFPQRTGRAHASVILRGEWGLAWRLTRGICIGWAIAMLLLGVSYGSIFNDMSSFMQSNAVYASIIGGSEGAQEDMVNSFISYLLLLMAIVAAVPVCMVILKLKGEEKHGRIEQVLAGGVNKMRLASGFLLIALVLSVVLILCTPLGMYASAAVMMDAPPALDMMIKASFNYLPALLVLVGLSMFFLGVMPKLSSIIWGYLSYCFLIAYLGNIMTASAADQTLENIFDALLKLSPFSVLPVWPAEKLEILLLAGMGVAAAGLAIIGLVAYRRRDIGN